MRAMKKFAITLLSVLMCLLASFSLIACGDEGGSGNGGTGGTGGGTGDGGTTPTPTPPPAVITVGEIGGGSFIYNGEEHKPEPSVTKDATALVKGTDYDLTYANNINAGTASVTVDFKGEYDSETDVTKNFTIAPKAVTPIVEIASGTYTYNGSAHTPAVTVMDGGDELEATDYEVAYANNTNAGTATVTVTLKGNYEGTKAEEFAIARAKVAKPEADDTVFTYTGLEQEYELAENAGYTITGDLTATNAGTETITVALNANYEWMDGTRDDATYDFVIAPFDASGATITVADIIVGAEPIVTVEHSEFNFANGDYTIDKDTYENIGTKTATVTFTGNFTGIATKNYLVTSVNSLAETYIDFNEEYVDRMGNSVVTARGTTHAYVESGDGTKGARLETNKQANYVVSNSLGANDFTIAFDVKLDSAAMPPDTSLHSQGTNAGYEMFSSGSSIDANGDSNPDTLQLSAQRRSPNFDRLFRLQLGLNQDYQRFTLPIEEAWMDSWINFTIVVDRDVEVTATEEKAKAYVYINGELKKTHDLTYYVQDQVLGNNNLNIGGALNWMPNRQMWMDNFYLFKRTLTADEVAGIAKSGAYEGAKTMWKSSGDITFDFLEDEKTEYTSSIVITKLSDTALLENLTFSANIAEYIGQPVTVGRVTTYPVTIPRANYADFIGGVEGTVTANGIARNITITYVPLAQVYVDKAEFKLEADEFAGGTGIITVGVFADETKHVPVKNIAIFSIGGEPLTATGGADGYYTLTLTKTQIENGVEITVSAESAGTVTPATVSVIEWKLDAEDINKLIANTVSYLNFDGNVNSYGAGTVNSYVRRDRDEANRYNENSTYNVNMYRRALTLEGIKLGARNDFNEENDWGSFTISMDVNGADLIATGDNGYGNILFGTHRVDSANGLNIMYRGTFDTNGAATEMFTLRAGTKTKNLSYKLYGAINYDRLMKWTFIFDRRTSGELKVSLYVDGVLVLDGNEFKVSVPDYFDLGATAQSALGIGGSPDIDDTANYPHAEGDEASKDFNVEIDNFLFYNGLMSYDEMKLVKYHYDDIVAKYDFVVDRKVVATLGAENYTATVVVRELVDGATITGATFSDGITATETASDGTVTYALTIPKTFLDGSVFSKTITMTLDGVTKKIIIDLADTGFTIDGVLDETAWANSRSFVYTSLGCSTAHVNDFKFILASDALYMGVKVIDPNVKTFTEAGNHNDSGFEGMFRVADGTYKENSFHLRFYADGTVRYFDSTYSTENNYSVWTWSENTATAATLTSAAVLTADGYTYELKIPYASIKTNNELTNFSAMFMQIAYMNDTEKHSLQFTNYSLGNHMPHDLDAYINFDRSGYAPDRVFGIANVTATETTGKTSAFYYVMEKSGAKHFQATDLVLEAEGVTFTANADGTYNYVITATESATIPVTVKNVAGHVLGSFNINYTAPQVA